MNTIVSRYLKDGFVAVDGLVSDTDIATTNQALIDVARGVYRCREFEPAAAEVGDDDALARVTCVHQPHFTIPALMEIVRHPGIVEILRQIVGAHLPSSWWDGSVKSMQSMLFCKPAGALGQAWHQDEAFIPTRDRSLCAAWIALDDATVDNGCLWVVPGGHRAGVIYPTRSHARPDEWDHSEEMFGHDSSGARPVEVAKGSVIFFNGYLPHMSNRNRTQHFRRAFVSHYMTMQSLLPWRLDPKDLEGWRAASADQRAVVPVAGVDPYATKGYRVPQDTMHLRGK